MKTPSTARKADTTRQARSVNESHLPAPSLHLQQGGSLPPAHAEDVSFDTTNTLRERLSQMFSDEARPRRRKSIDVVSALIAQSGDATLELLPKKQRTKSDVVSQHSGAASAHSLLLRDVPKRTSSLSISRQASVQDFPSWRLPPPAAAGLSIPPRGKADSPIKRSKGPVSSDDVRPLSSRTFVRSSPPIRLLQHGNSSHRRVRISTHLKAPLFVGGGTIEGEIRLAIVSDENIKDVKRSLLISKLSVDVVFLALATELFDEKYPPPPGIVTSQEPTKGPELFWSTKPGRASLPFCINLPLNLGPPPYLSKQASIRYILLPTLVIQNGHKRDVVTQLCNIQMLTVYDPIKALSSLPSPLVATETLQIPGTPGPQSIVLSAGLHRQTWVSGNSIFVDIHIINKSQRTLRKLELQLQRYTLWYDHAAAETGSKSAHHLRIPKKQDTDIVNVTVVKKVKGEWTGTPPSTSEVRTCHIQVPQGHVTISTGRFFEVRYFLNVVVTVTMFKSVSVQLPVSLIHMNSLDVLPNALAQVAASIEAKRSKALPTDPSHPLYQPYHQGQAFVAPRKSSLEQGRSRRQSVDGAGLEELKKELDKSPRRYQQHHRCIKAKASTDTLRPRENLEPVKKLHQHKSECLCYHCHLLNIERRPSTSQSRIESQLPRLQVSTSGLGFTESEFSDFSVQDSPPKKVMLSEQERKMVHQQRELQQRKEYAETQRRASAAASRRNSRRASNRTQTAANASALLEAQIKRAESHVLDPKPRRGRSKTHESPLQPVKNPNVQRLPSSGRRRANTGPAPLKLSQTDAENLTRGALGLQDPPQLVRLSSKRRGKMPAVDTHQEHQRPASTQGARPQSRHRRMDQGREVGDRLMR